MIILGCLGHISQKTGSDS